MAKRHDENKDLHLISRIAKIDYSNKTIRAPKSAIIGNRSWGRIDYLTHYCGWYFIWDNSVKIAKVIIDNSDTKPASKREAKQAIKDNSLTNKKKR